ncbi:Stk1 family PASTA domain-containing Ser/Thr kinase [Streptomyces sp. TP-A0874]|uniref:Stk1 family PASTA domain-containing Ser/Thr kinase n=1 Tax=Streptomyces sp. TP-A0874 TaxID=549819 RepID=UPI000852AAAA|nr:Stk1 family PASTA domain-containing Ser/Thr kinase [Streptomyces sp. TP-A0874]
MDTTLQDPLVGQVLDSRYRVDARVAVGGMATVYRAMDTRLDRVLALKVMHPALAADEAFVDRFIREAKAVARLDHPNVVGVYDQGTDGTYVYLAMEYVAGCTLRDVLRERGALRPRIAMDVLEPILAALGAAHRAELVHRDMKPENVLIGDDGRVKVADFGLARPVDTNTSASSGALLGTVSYLAPEQIEHGTADTRVDVYACGILLYEMLTGGKPHTGGTPAQVLYQHLHEDVPPPSETVAGLAPELDALVAAATARSPEARPADAVALLARAKEARKALTDEQLDTVPPQALAREPSGSEDLTSVIPRHGAGRALPAPAGADPLNLTTRLEPSEAVSGTGPLEPGGGPGRRGGRWWLPSRGVLALLAAVLMVVGLGAGVWYINSGQFTRVPGVLDMPRQRAERVLSDKGLSVSLKEAFSDTVEQGRVISSAPEPGSRVRGNGTVTLTVSRGPELVKVPDVQELPLGEAKRKLRKAGLAPGIVNKEFDEEVPPGSVIRTTPEAGTERRSESAIAIIVSRGAPIETPDVVGDSVDEAREALEEVGLKVKIATSGAFSKEDKGSVAEQSPGRGEELAKGDTVTLTLSKGQEMIKVPNVEGMHQDEARKKLEKAGFKVRVSRFFLGDTVFSQSVGGGEKAPKGSQITIRIR